MRDAGKRLAAQAGRPLTLVAPAVCKLAVLAAEGEQGLHVAGRIDVAEEERRLGGGREGDGERPPATRKAGHGVDAKTAGGRMVRKTGDKVGRSGARVAAAADDNGIGGRFGHVILRRAGTGEG